MKKNLLLLSVIALLSYGSASAQISAEAAAPQAAPTFNNEIKSEQVSNEHSAAAAAREARKAILKERNTIEMNVGVNGSLSNFNVKWQEVNGNNNSISGIANFLFTHSFKKERFTIDNKVTAKLGVTGKGIGTDEYEWVKSQDEWFVSTSPAYKMTDNWNLAAIISLRSQFANGVDKDNIRTSSIFAPAYFNVSVGFTYVCPKEKFPIKINLSPLSMNSTIVMSDAVHNSFFRSKKFVDVDGNAIESYADYLAAPDMVAKQDKALPYCYGLTLADGNSRWEGGSSIQIDFDRSFGKNGFFRYRTTLYSFYGWINEISQQTNKSGIKYEHIAPTIRWEHTIDIKASKYISTQLYFQMYYNKAQCNSLQTQTVLGVGLSYTFKNKE